MSVARRIAAAVLPEPAKRAHQHVMDRRRAHAVAGPTRAYVAAHGTEVRHGPLAGLRYPADALDSGTDYLGAKLVGTYELELHEAISEWIEARHANVVDVGCAEGFYAVGLAVKMPDTIVHAYDVDASARERCGALAELNGVGARVRIGEACTPDTLAALPADDTVLLCDCEGYERTLLDPDAATVLRSWPVLVELHDFLDVTITDTIAERFGTSHRVELIVERPRDGLDIPELEALPASQRRVLVDEHRPALMRWAYLRPARSSTASVSDA